jgi:hypothetical protein
VNFLPDSLVTGLPFLLGGVAVVLASLPERCRVAEGAATYLFVLFVGAPMAGLDAQVPWAAFSEICLAVGLLLFVTALV